jgi:hypothetical protein
LPIVQKTFDDVGQKPYMSVMDEFMDKVRGYAGLVGVSPSTIIQRAAKLGGTTWSKWESGGGSPSMKTVDKILKYIADNPISDADAEPLEAVG